MITVYRSDDAGAPVLSGTAGALINVLDACLVDGYGDQLAAGWEKAYSATSRGAYRAASGNRFYLDVTDTDTRYPVLRGYRQMTAIGVGTGPFPSAGQLSSGVRTMKSSASGSTPRPWVLIASPRAFYLWIAADAVEMSGYTLLVDVVFFGDAVSYLPGDAYMTLLIGKSTADITAANTRFGNTLTTGADSAGHYIASDWIQTGNATPCGCLQTMPGTSTSTGSIGCAYPDPITGSLLLDRMRVCEGGVSQYLVRGHLPGVYNPAHNQPGNHLDVLQGRGVLTGTDLLLLYKGGTAGRLAFSLNEADWHPED